MANPLSTADALALLRLHAAGGAGAPRRALLDAHPSPARALAAGPAAWRRAGLDPRQVAALRASARAGGAGFEAALDWLRVPGHHLLGWQDPDYPPPLRRIAAPPTMLFVAGDATLLWRPAVAVVGSRAATAGGREHASRFARALGAAGLVVASGLARGVDAAAHRAALGLPGGTTVAVLGCGPDVAYPLAHRDLLAEVATRGAVVSEHPPGTGARREYFPSRNRILAGLTLGTVVVEAGERSGALITARQAAEAGREVFALPGSIDNPLARGCHRLIRDGALLVETPEQVLHALAPMASHQASDLRTLLDAPTPVPPSGAGTSAPPGPPAHPDYNRLWSALGHDPTPMDQLVERSGLTAAELSSMLLVMELEGRVAVGHGRYTRR